MNDENNNNHEARFARIENALAETAERVAEINKMQLRAEFERVESRRRHEAEIAEIRALQKQSDEKINHLVELIRYFGDKTFEFDAKFEGMREALNKPVQKS